MTKEEAKVEIEEEFKIFLKGISLDNEEILEEKMKENAELRKVVEANRMAIKALEQESKIGHCKDCRWWKDKDGIYRRGIDAESKCSINRKEVFDGNGYCYMFESQESEEDKE